MTAHPPSTCVSRTPRGYRVGMAVDIPIDPDLAAIEESGWRALSADSDTAAAFYDAVLAAQPLMVLPGGLGLDDRDAIIDAMRGQPWERFTLDDVQTRPLGPETALLTYRASATRAEQGPYDALMTSIYVLKEGEWKLAFHQQTPL